MRHGVKKIQFTKGQDAHQALTRKLLVNFVKHGYIETTQKRGKVLKASIDRLVGKAQRGQQSDRNVLLKHFASKKIVESMINVIAPTFQGQVSGFVSMKRLGVRQGDDAEVVRLAWVKPITPAEQGISEEPLKTEKKTAPKKVVAKIKKTATKKA